jgi:curved DNA-binding protein CbpA
MIVNCIRRLANTRTPRTAFATLTRDQYNYYNVLEVEDGATETAIRAAYAELTRGLIPETDAKRFKELSEAFVILTDGKTREAYDSLLRVRKTHYLSSEEPSLPATRSYLSQRRQDKYPLIDLGSSSSNPNLTSTNSEGTRAVFPKNSDS